MIGSAIYEQVQAKIDQCMTMLLGHTYTKQVTFSFRKNMKRVAGFAYQHKNHIELNEQLFVYNTEEFFSTTIPHECAHIIQFLMYPYAKQFHGPEFRAIMNTLGAPDDTRHMMDTSVAFDKPMYKYTCGCVDRVHTLTKLIHTRIQSGSNRSCKLCSTRITFKELS